MNWMLRKRTKALVVCRVDIMAFAFTNTLLFGIFPEYFKAS